MLGPARQDVNRVVRVVKEVVGVVVGLWFVVGGWWAGGLFAQ